MSTQTPSPFNTDFLKNLTIPGLDVNALMASQNKTLEAVMEAHKVALAGMQAVAKRQEEILRSALSEVQSVVKEMKSPEKYAELSAELVRKSMDQARELAELVAKANQDVVAVVTKRAQDSLAELKSMVKSAKA